MEVDQRMGVTFQRREARAYGKKMGRCNNMGHDHVARTKVTGPEIGPRTGKKEEEDKQEDNLVAKDLSSKQAVHRTEEALMWRLREKWLSIDDAQEPDSEESLCIQDEVMGMIT
ncbi:hypothetical protein R1sor_021062 [Riccia sorocarpa]|uniref:Uncharacterized protein n=1 Tax=Riccia sorocarpa TaxID=122646 RepID=A0ABD3GHM1_9MARC